MEVMRMTSSQIQMKKQEKKLKELRIKLTIINVSVVAISVLLILTFMVKVHNNAYIESVASYDKYFAQVDIGREDTVWTLFDKTCEQYPDTATYDRTKWINEVRSINHLDYDYKITYGHSIIVPYLNGKKELAE